MIASMLIWAPLIIGCARNQPTPLPAPTAASQPDATDELHLVAGCEIRGRRGELLRVFPGNHCVYLPEGDLITYDGGALVRMSTRGRVRWKVALEASLVELTSLGDLLLLTNTVHTYKGRPAIFNAIEQRATDGSLLWRWDTFDHVDELRRHHPPHPILDEIPYREGEVLPFEGVPSVLFRSPGYRPSPNGPRAALRARLPEFHFLDGIRRVAGGRVEGPPPAPGTPDPGRTSPLVEGPAGAARVGPTVRLEYYHANAVQRLPANSVARHIPAFRPGNFLLSLCNFSMLAIIDADTHAVVWTYALPGYFPGQHDAQLLPNGHILMFVNSDVCPHGYCSAVVEFDPLTRENVWVYRPEPPAAFHSVFMGSVQRLANGNTLVSSMGRPARIFEVTPDKRVVWTWNVPERNEPRPVSVRRVPAAPLSHLLEPF